MKCAIWDRAIEVNVVTFLQNPFYGQLSSFRNMQIEMFWLYKRHNWEYILQATTAIFIRIYNIIGKYFI